MKPVALITGSAGGIGAALVKAFMDAGYTTIGVDRTEPAHGTSDVFLAVDLLKFVDGYRYRNDVIAAITSHLPNGALRVLINNAALQVVGPTEAVALGDWNDVMAVNVTAPFLLAQSLLVSLERGQGSIINIASIHAQLTKPGFVAYATSKAALEGMTRAMAVDVGSRVRVNAIAPAAIETSMLRAGFQHAPEKLDQLRKYHPAGVIGQAEEVADLALFMASPNQKFMNGSVIQLNGGIAARLHDPV